MTVALNDVVLLSQLLHSCPDLSDPLSVSSLLKRWHWSRKPLSSTINILSVALYDLFGADGAYICAFLECLDVFLDCNQCIY
jgi:squalene monooxygenase